MVLNEMMRRALFAVAALGLVGPGLAGIGSARAQDATPSHLAAARSAVDAVDSTEQFDNILLNAATQIKADLIGSNPDMQSAISDMVDDRALALAPRRGDLENEAARIYAKLFTEQELTAIAAFYNSDAGKKLLKQGPVATREMLAAADVWSNGIVRDLRTSAAAGMAQLMPQASNPAAPLTAPVGAADAADAAPGTPAADATSTQ